MCLNLYFLFVVVSFLLPFSLLFSFFTSFSNWECVLFVCVGICWYFVFFIFLFAIFFLSLIETYSNTHKINFFRCSSYFRIIFFLLANNIRDSHIKPNVNFCCPCLRRSPIYIRVYLQLNHILMLFSIGCMYAFIFFCSLYVLCFFAFCLFAVETIILLFVKFFVHFFDFHCVAFNVCNAYTV